MTNPQVQAEFTKLCFLVELEGLKKLVNEHEFLEKPYKDFIDHRKRKQMKLNKLLKLHNLEEIE